MARQKKEISERMKVFAEELKDLHNSDEFHGLFDMIVEIEAEGDSSSDKVIALIERHIEKRYFRELEDPAAMSEAAFILECFGKAVGVLIKEKNYHLLTDQETRDDLICTALNKLITNAEFDITAPKAQKFTFIKTVLDNSYLDHWRSVKSKAEEEFRDESYNKGRQNPPRDEE